MSISKPLSRKYLSDLSVPHLTDTTYRRTFSRQQPLFRRWPKWSPTSLPLAPMCPRSLAVGLETVNGFNECWGRFSTIWSIGLSQRFLGGRKQSKQSHCERMGHPLQPCRCHDLSNGNTPKLACSFPASFKFTIGSKSLSIFKLARFSESQTTQTDAPSNCSAADVGSAGTGDSSLMQKAAISFLIGSNVVMSLCGTVPEAAKSFPLLLPQSKCPKSKCPQWKCRQRPLNSRCPRRNKQSQSCQLHLWNWRQLFQRVCQCP